MKRRNLTLQCNIEENPVFSWRPVFPLAPIYSTCDNFHSLAANRFGKVAMISVSVY